MWPPNRQLWEREQIKLLAMPLKLSRASGNSITRHGISRCWVGSCLPGRLDPSRSRWSQFQRGTIFHPCKQLIVLFDFSRTSALHITCVVVIIVSLMHIKRWRSHVAKWTKVLMTRLLSLSDKINCVMVFVAARNNTWALFQPGHYPSCTRISFLQFTTKN